MSEGASERGGGDRGEEEARGSLARPESTGDLCRFAELRRAILAAWGHDLQRDERGKWRGGRGHFIGEVLMASNSARSEWGSNTGGYWF
jgi:hypothetical protein